MLIDYDQHAHEVAPGIGVDGARCYGCGRTVVAYYTLRSRVTGVMQAAGCVDCAERAGWPLERLSGARQRDFVGAA